MTGWSVPVPIGTPTVERPAIALDARHDRITLAEVGRIGTSGDPEQLFYRISDVATDRQGNIYVLDAGNYRVQGFDPYGRFVRSIGRRGQGPGEFESPLRLAVAGDRVAVVSETGRLSTWHVDGTFLREHQIDVAGPIRSFFGTDGGKVVLGHVVRQAQPFTGRLIGVGERYRVSTIDLADWALRVPWQNEPVTDEVIDASIRSLRERNPGTSISRSAFEWPKMFPALSSLSMDGHGHIYVYPYPLRSSEAGSDVPVDVYDRDGELPWGGLISPRRWRAASGDFVILYGGDRFTDEEVVVRYRLSEPF